MQISWVATGPIEPGSVSYRVKTGLPVGAAHLKSGRGQLVWQLSASGIYKQTTFSRLRMLGGWFSRFSTLPVWLITGPILCGSAIFQING